MMIMIIIGLIVIIIMIKLIIIIIFYRKKWRQNFQSQGELCQTHIFEVDNDFLCKIMHCYCFCLELSMLNKIKENGQQFKCIALFTELFLLQENYEVIGDKDMGISLPHRSLDCVYLEYQKMRTFMFRTVREILIMVRVFQFPL